MVGILRDELRGRIRLTPQPLVEALSVSGHAVMSSTDKFSRRSFWRSGSGAFPNHNAAVALIPWLRTKPRMI